MSRALSKKEEELRLTDDVVLNRSDQPEVSSSLNHDLHLSHMQQSDGLPALQDVFNFSKSDESYDISADGLYQSLLL